MTNLYYSCGRKDSLACLRKFVTSCSLSESWLLLRHSLALGSEPFLINKGTEYCQRNFNGKYLNSFSQARNQWSVGILLTFALYWFILLRSQLGNSVERCVWHLCLSFTVWLPTFQVKETRWFPVKKMCELDMVITPLSSQHQVVRQR